MQTGLSEFASARQDGTVVDVPRFPWALLLRPSSPAERGADAEPEGNFLQQLARLEPGTTVYRIYACASPSDAKEGPLQHIGDVVMVSEFVESELEHSLRFRHQLKEDDYALRPSWVSQLRDAHRNYGWEHFAELPQDISGRWRAHNAWVHERATQALPAKLASTGVSRAASKEESGYRKRRFSRATVTVQVFVLLLLVACAQAHRAQLFFQTMYGYAESVEEFLSDDHFNTTYFLALALPLLVFCSLRRRGSKQELDQGHEYRRDCVVTVAL
jgi:hypothetical protein